MWALIAKYGWMALQFAAGLIANKLAGDPTVTAHDDGEKLGKAETDAANATEGLREIDAAKKSEDGYDAKVSAASGDVRSASADFSSPRGPDGVS